MSYAAHPRGLRRTSIQCLTASRTVRSTQCKDGSNHLEQLLWLPCCVSYFGCRRQAIASTLQSQTGLRLRLCLIHTTLGRTAPLASPQALPPSKHHAKSQNLTRWCAQKRKHSSDLIH